MSSNRRVTSSEAELSSIYEELWKLDKNRLEEDVDFKINKQAFIALLDNYEADIGVKEVVTRTELKENDRFLDAILDTEVMKKTHRFLINHQLSPVDEKEFKKQLGEIWFGLYSRSRSTDSSAFEHVFVGERRGQNLIGFHNWITFYLAEKKGLVDYHGFYFGDSRDCGPGGAELLTIAFDDDAGALKRKSSILVGSSPEFEIAIYTIAHLTNQRKPIVEFGQCRLQITCHEMRNGDLGTCYLEAAKRRH